MKTRPCGRFACLLAVSLCLVPSAGAATPNDARVVCHRSQMTTGGVSGPEYACGSPWSVDLTAEDVPQYKGWAAFLRPSRAGDGPATITAYRWSGSAWTSVTLSESKRCANGASGVSPDATRAASSGRAWVDDSGSACTPRYVWPYASGWVWIWSADIGWVAARSRDVLLPLSRAWVTANMQALACSRALYADSDDKATVRTLESCYFR